MCSDFPITIKPASRIEGICGAVQLEEDHTQLSDCFTSRFIFVFCFAVQRIRYKKIIAMSRTTVKANGLPQNTQNMDTSNHIDEPKAAKYCLKSLINAVIYAICIISLGLSLYLNYRQSLIEDNIKNLLYLDNKVIRIETDLDDLIRKSNIFYTLINQNRSKQTAVEEDIEGLPPVEMVGKLSLNVFSDLHRLKRDVSTLKMARKQRQTAIQQSSPNECACPAGKCKQIKKLLWNVVNGRDLGNHYKISKKLNLRDCENIFPEIDHHLNWEIKSFHVMQNKASGAIYFSRNSHLKSRRNWNSH